MVRLFGFIVRIGGLISRAHCLCGNACRIHSFLGQKDAGRERWDAAGRSWASWCHYFYHGYEVHLFVSPFLLVATVGYSLR